jgi:hypothetical protein
MSRKEKKAAIRARVKKQQIINNNLGDLKQDIAISAVDTAAYISENTETFHADRINSIKSRLQDKKAASLNKWNRFAGTSGAGGRGL